MKKNILLGVFLVLCLSACNNKPQVDDNEELVACENDKCPDRSDMLRDKSDDKCVHEYVDLGLPSGTKWAKCNIGATTETDYGDYFAWGEIKPKKEYTKDNYTVAKIVKLPDSTYVDNDGFTHTIEGKEISDIAGTIYDAATANWGKGWSMPTKEQFKELLDKCQWEWVSKNGVNGYKVTGPNGKYIFLPAAGFRYGTETDNVGFDGSYWSSSLYSDYTDLVWGLYFSSGGHSVDDADRCFGQSVRAVRP